MSKYKLINSVTKIETLCDKVMIDGFEYYVSDETPKLNDVVITSVGNIHYIKDNSKDFIEYISKLGKKIIATTNPNIDVPKVVDEVERLAEACSEDLSSAEINDAIIFGFKAGYNKSQETHPFSEEDMIEFSEWLDRNTYVFDGSPTLSKNGKSIGIAKDKLYCRVDYTLSDNNCGYTTKELLQLWKEQQPKIVYYG